MILGMLEAFSCPYFVYAEDEMILVTLNINVAESHSSDSPHKCAETKCASVRSERMTLSARVSSASGLNHSTQQLENTHRRTDACPRTHSSHSLGLSHT